MLLQVSRINAIAVVVVSLAGLYTTASAEPHSATDYSRYLGTYVFEDGVRVTGGRFDESGATMLLYTDTWNQRRGNLFRKSGDEFAALYGGDMLTFSDDGRVMHWRTADGETLRASRTLQPERQAATFSNGDVVLHGTLYRPPGVAESIGAVVLAHGSGPTTRHIGPWITFFLEQGFAVLAYDKRGTGESGGDWKATDYFTLANDLAAAADWLTQQERIDAERIGVHTSSQSGWYGPYLASLHDGIAFLIQRAAPAVNIGVGTAHEIRNDLRREGVDENAIEAGVDFWKALHALAGRKGSLSDARKLLTDARQQDWFAAAFGDWDEISAAWWDRHVVNMQLEPAETAGKLSIPVLWFLADEDENVPYRASSNALGTARKQNPALKLVTVNDAGHDFLVPDGAGGQRYTQQYWQVMAEWLAGLDRNR